MRTAIVAFVVVAVMTVTMVGCGDTSSTPAPKTGAPATTPMPPIEKAPAK